MEGVFKIEHDPQAERPTRLGSGHEQGVEHAAALLLMVGKTTKEQRRALAAG